MAPPEEPSCEDPYDQDEEHFDGEDGEDGEARPQVVLPAWFGPTLVGVAVTPVVLAAIAAWTRVWPASLVGRRHGNGPVSWRLRFVVAYLVLGAAIVAVLFVAAAATKVVRAVRSRDGKAR